MNTTSTTITATAAKLLIRLLHLLPPFLLYHFSNDNYYCRLYDYYKLKQLRQLPKPFSTINSAVTFSQYRHHNHYRRVSMPTSSSLSCRCLCYVIHFATSVTFVRSIRHSYIIASRFRPEDMNIECFPFRLDRPRQRGNGYVAIGGVV